MNTPAELPPPRTPGRYRLAVVCLGNICRSPMAHVVLEDRLARAGLADRVEVVSSGTGDWHVGKPMDPRAAATLRAAGLDPSRHRAQQWRPDALDDLDLVLAMDTSNLADLTAPSSRAPVDGPPDPRVRLFRDHDPVGTGQDVPDPYYGGDAGFEEVLQMVERTSDALVAALEQELGRR